MRIRPLFPTVLLFIAALCGCAAHPPNPSFPLSRCVAKAEIEAMSSQPTALARPLIVLAGWLDPGFAVREMRDEMRRVVGDDRVLAVPFGSCKTFDDCRARLIERVSEAFPHDDPRWTAEVDVIGISMGGLIARDAALERTDEKRLRIARLFTIATPHRGAAMASLPTFNRLQIDMRPGSAYLERVRSSASTFAIYPYVRLGDAMVGPANAAPDGTEAWWVPDGGLSFAHLFAHRDPRIVADIARRLRDESPYARQPPTSLPRGH